jgi:hypothetical protein
MTVEQNSCQNIGVYQDLQYLPNEMRNAKIQQTEFTNKKYSIRKQMK